MKRKTSFFSSIKVKLIVAMVAVAAVPLIAATTINFISSANKSIITEKDNLEIDLTKNLDVYSCYKENPVTVSDGTTIKVLYDCLGGTDGPDPAEVTFKKTETFHLSDKIPKKEGYYFEG